LNAGTRIWESIDKAISNKHKSDGWAIFVTENSLNSQPCREEIAIALDRALMKDSDFPMIGIFSKALNRKIIPSAIATRLYVNLSDPDWGQKIANSLNKKQNEGANPPEPYGKRLHKTQYGYQVEVWPRSGRWFPFFIVVPDNQMTDVGVCVMYGPSNFPPVSGISQTRDYGYFLEGINYRGWEIGGQAIDQSISAYLALKKSPISILFGQKNSEFYKLDISY
jgi:hypothetical protein